MSASVTVILTFYNNSDYVDSALEQIDAIDDTDFDLIVTDDGSTDGTRERLHVKLARRPRTRFLTAEANLGIAAMRNWAVREATSDYVWFVDCDDRWEPRALALMRKAVVSSGGDVAMVQAMRVLHRDQRVGKPLDAARSGLYEGEALLRLLLTGGIRGYLWNKLIRRELLLRHPFPARRAQEDFAVISQIAFAGARFACIEQVAYWHVERAGSLTNSAVRDYSDLQETCAAVVQGVLNSTYAEGLRRETIFFEQWYFLSSVVNTSTRLGLAERNLASFVADVRRQVTWSRIACTWRFSRREALIAVAIKILGPAYAPVYRTYLNSRRLATLWASLRPSRRMKSRQR